MRFLIFILTILILTACARRHKKEELKITFTDGSGKHLKTFREEHLVKVEWEEQCYHFKKNVVEELQRLNLNHATIELIFNDEVLASWRIVTVYEAELQTTLILMCDPDTGKIIMDDSICVGNMRYDYYFGIRSNAELEAYLRRINLVRVHG
jgi:hypothetical protein